MPIDYARARRTIASRDPVLGDLMRRHGRCGLDDSQHTDPFQALVHAIVSQQLSTKAAATIASRLDELLGSPAPARVAAVSDVQLRAVGLSGQKVGYLRDLCRCLEDGSLRLDALDHMTDDEVIAALTSVKVSGDGLPRCFSCSDSIGQTSSPSATLASSRRSRWRTAFAHFPRRRECFAWVKRGDRIAPSLVGISGRVSTTFRYESRRHA
jgi:DNA-3-methyladenine glycosylase II